jgi:hypothetical protein
LSRKLGLEFELNPYDLNPSPSQHTHESVSKVYDFHLVTGSGNKVIFHHFCAISCHIGCSGKDVAGEGATIVCPKTDLVSISDTLDVLMYVLKLPNY